jgi:hypothetical protein
VKYDRIGTFQTPSKKPKGMQKNGEADGFSVSPAHSHFSELGPLVDSRNVTVSSKVVKLPIE